MRVDSVMSEKVHCVHPETSLSELRQIFSEVVYHHLLVTKDEQLVGVISDRDVLRMSSPTLDDDPIPDLDKWLLEQKTESFMSTQLVMAKPDTLIDAAAILLLENNISCLPVVSDDERVAGIITWKDMLKYYVYVS